MSASTSGAPSTDELTDEATATSARATGRRGMRIYTGFIGAVAVGIALVPVFASNYTKTFVLQALMSCALAASWNLISGFTGYVSFGHSAFFGIGAYATGIAIVRGGLPAPIAIIVAGISSATAGLLFGYPA
ncbi:MAG: hypothetical protein EB107_10150, partial [Proteobacteria bacterium]|nr:hypothetical protein [Pseudomonadota bacterium]